MGGWIQDFKYAVRSIAGAKKFAAIVVATLALGIGANSAVFGVLNAAVLRPLPYDEPDRLVRVYASDNGIDGYLPGPVVVALRESSRTLDVAALYTYSAEGADLTDRGQPERVRTLSVSADYPATAYWPASNRLPRRVRRTATRMRTGVGKRGTFESSRPARRMAPSSDAARVRHPFPSRAESPRACQRAD